MDLEKINEIKKLVEEKGYSFTPKWCICGGVQYFIEKSGKRDLAVITPITTTKLIVFIYSEKDTRKDFEDKDKAEDIANYILEGLGTTKYVIKQNLQINESIILPVYLKEIMGWHFCCTQVKDEALTFDSRNAACKFMVEQDLPTRYKVVELE